MGVAFLSSDEAQDSKAGETHRESFSSIVPREAFLAALVWSGLVFWGPLPTHLPIKKLGSSYTSLLALINSFFYLHLFSTIPAPCSSYSFFEIHIWWNVPRDETMLPPIHDPNFRSTLIPDA